jgi:hypothetical protein
VLEENPCIIKLVNSWLILNPGGGPTPDKPDISVIHYEPGNTVSTFMNLRVADIHACYEQWRGKGAEFLTRPIHRGAEIRCYMRDPDGYMIEVGQSTGLLKGDSPRSGRKICPANATGQNGARADAPSRSVAPRASASVRRQAGARRTTWSSRRAE